MLYIISFKTRPPPKKINDSPRSNENAVEDDADRDLSVSPPPQFEMSPPLHLSTQVSPGTMDNSPAKPIQRELVNDVELQESQGEEPTGKNEESDLIFTPDYSKIITKNYNNFLVVFNKTGLTTKMKRIRG